MRFASPELLVLLVVLPIMGLRRFRLWPFHATAPPGSVLFSRVSRMNRIRQGEAHTRHWTFLLRLLTVACLIVGLARPQFAAGLAPPGKVEGRDIVLAIDISGSMTSLDMDPDFDPEMIRGPSPDLRSLQSLDLTRLDAAKGVATRFVRGREYDRIGLVSFAVLDNTRCPLTADRETAIRAINGLEFAPPDQSGTAIGDALTRSLKRLLASTSKSRVILLITDGKDTGSHYHPKDAARIAASLPVPVRIYTIGIGRMGTVPAVDPRTASVRLVQYGFDPVSLRQVAGISGGEYYHAQNLESLQQVFQQIDQLEKTPLPDRTRLLYQEGFSHFVIPALIFLLTEILLTGTLWRRFP